MSSTVMYAAASLVLALVASHSLPFAVVDTSSGRFDLAFRGSLGQSEYVVLYKYPKSAPVDSNLTVTFTVFVLSLNGSKLFVGDYGLILTLSFSSGQVVTKELREMGGSAIPLYEGSRWGPVNITLSIPESAVGGLSPGQSASGSLSVRFIANVWYDVPVRDYYAEADERPIGSVNIFRPAGDNFAGVLYALGAMIIVAIATVVSIKIRRGSRVKFPVEHLLSSIG